jgi:hypothetical protein
MLRLQESWALHQGLALAKVGQLTTYSIVVVN